MNSPRNQPYLNRAIVEEVVGNAFFNAAGLLGTRAMNKLRKRTAGTVTKFRIAADRERFRTLKPDLSRSLKS